MAPKRGNQGNKTCFDVGDITAMIMFFSMFFFYLFKF